MKRISIILFCLLSNFAFGQFIESISFSELPQDFQLFPRDSNRNAVIPIKGTVLNRWKIISVVVFREGKIYTSQKAKINSPLNNFNLNPAIRAEKAEYSFKVYASDNDKDSTFIFERKNIVAGDFYVIYGDSNANTQGVVTYYPTNKYIRTFGTFNHDIQAAGYLAKDTLWSVNENYYLPKVGAWGTNLQEIIASKYDIPVCIITGGGPGMYIDLLADRTGNPFTTGGVYNTFAYRVKKSRLIDHIKGFFFWHGVYELFSKTDAAAYDKKLRKLMGFFQQDFPNTKQFYIFQNDMVSAKFNEAGADIRESQRYMASLFPQTTPYAAMGLTGSDGVHYTLEGYKKLADEMLQILEPQFYGKQPNANNFSPNIQKVFFTDATHKTIKMIFQESQNIVLGNDTIVNYNGNNLNLSLKKNFYTDKIYSQNIDIQSITANGNVVLVQSNNLIGGKTLSYLPPYHAQYSTDFPVFVGPFFKNSFGQRGLSFAGIKIQEPLQKISNLTSKSTTSDVKLTWNKSNISQNSQIILERKAEKESDFKRITVLKNDATEYQDLNLQSSSSFLYRLKILADSSESDYAQITANTLMTLGKPNAKTTILYNNKVQLDWTIPAGAEKFQVLWKQASASQYTVFTVPNSSNNLTFDGLKAGDKYVFRIDAFRNSTNEITTDSVSVTMPSLLAKPELSSTVLFYNSLKINWKAITGAISYILERKTSNEDFKQIATLDGKVVEWLEKDLKENTTYTYRLKAFGDKTESLESTISANTSAVLATPEITADQITHESVKLKWKVIPNATKYVLERQADGESNFTKILETNSLLENIETLLKSNQKYTYRLKAFSDVSESAFGVIEVKTLVILANQNEENSVFKVYPNPTQDKLNISFSEPFTGNIALIDILGRNYLEVKTMQQKSVMMNVSGLQRGIYFVVIKGNGDSYSKKVLVE
jgi:Secretion system C-terminal sorting domain/Carbohydrate esterase, sialic acid-specific acetylesterase/Fibronectin type III domain